MKFRIELERHVITVPERTLEHAIPRYFIDDVEVSEADYRDALRVDVLENSGE